MTGRVRDTDGPQGAGEALAMALADNGYVDDDREEQYRLIDTLPILAALASRGFEIVPRAEAALLARPTSPDPETRVEAFRRVVAEAKALGLEGALSLPGGPSQHIGGLRAWGDVD